MNLKGLEPKQQEALETLTSAEDEVRMEFPRASFVLKSLFRAIRELIELTY